LLTSVVVNVQLDALAQTSTTFSLNLEPGSDTVLILAPINGSIGAHTLTVSVTSPNGDTDAFPGNDGLQSFIYITGSTITAPFTESFTSSTFPPTGWQVWNPQENTTWVRNAASGYTEAGTASVQNYNYNGGGQLDELLTPAIELGGADSALLQF